ncbi:MAG: hypothetical protein J0H26_04345, partial [Alphaproteobacteria bacterium]|nr:hypothetical protein [Alphaproteobacteria bacterium]
GASFAQVLHARRAYRWKSSSCRWPSGVPLLPFTMARAEAAPENGGKTVSIREGGGGQNADVKLLLTIIYL